MERQGREYVCANQAKNKRISVALRGQESKWKGRGKGDGDISRSISTLVTAPKSCTSCNGQQTIGANHSGTENEFLLGLGTESIATT